VEKEKSVTDKASAPPALCALLRQERAAILDDWEAATRARHPDAAKLDKEALRDDVPPLLDSIVEALEAASKGHDVQLPHRIPREHAQHRLAVGFTLDIVAHEYALLREIMIEKLHTRLENVPTEMMRILHRFVDQAIIEAVMAFSEGADAQRDADQAQRSEFERHLLGIVSHDLRTPLQAITASASLLLRAANLDDRQLRLLAGITSSVARANRLIQDLLDFTSMRIGEGLEIVPAEVDLHEIALGAITELQLNHSEREIRLACTGDCEGHWDGERIGQVLTNLLTNALKFSTGHSTIDVRLTGLDEAVRVEVHNMGPHIPKAQQEKLFKPMERGKEGGKESQGLGLGLYIAKHIVEAHGGRIEVQSSARAGTTFAVMLPRSGSARPSPD
jgi:signal transduction histidine kinase